MNMPRAAVTLWGLLALGASPVSAAESRVVAVGGAVTEIVYALDAGEHLVGVDTTSTWPAAAQRLPQVGYQRALSAEGVLSLAPSLVLATTDAGPPAVIEQIRATGVAVHVVAAEPSLAGVRNKVRGIARALGREAQGERLLRTIENDLARVREFTRDTPQPPRVLFVLDHGGGSPQAAGGGTTADAMIRLAGGINAVTAFEGFRPLSAEAVVTAAPDVILLTSQSLTRLGGAEGLGQIAGVALTPAGRAGRVIAMESLYLLGFGPRIGQAAAELAAKLHPTAATVGKSARRAAHE